MAELLKKLEEKANKKRKPLKRQLPQRPRLIELWLAERPLSLLVRGLIGLADHKLELTYLKQKEPKPLNPDEKPDYVT